MILFIKNKENKIKINTLYKFFNLLSCTIEVMHSVLNTQIPTGKRAQVSFCNQEFTLLSITSDLLNFLWSIIIF